MMVSCSSNRVTHEEYKICEISASRTWTKSMRLAAPKRADMNATHGRQKTGGRSWRAADARHIFQEKQLGGQPLPPAVQS